jgi:hypothetical protein
VPGVPESLPESATEVEGCLWAGMAVVKSIPTVTGAALSLIVCAQRDVGLLSKRYLHRNGRWKVRDLLGAPQ